MTRLALELDDRTLAVARDGVVTTTLPAVAFDGSGGEPLGAPAWDAQRRTPTHVSSRHFTELAAGASPKETTLALAASQLASRLEPHRPDEATLWITAPAGFDPAGLAAVLAMVRRIGFNPAGFVDAATASVGMLTSSRSALVLEIGLHHVGVTAVERGGEARRRRASVYAQGGLLELYEAWLELIRAAMVKQTRFDPLHDAATDQRVFDLVPGVARDAAANGSATAKVTVGDERFEVELSRDQFARAGEPVYREILRLLRELRQAGAPVSIVAPRLILDLPGLRDALASFRNCELVAVADGFAAAAATLLDLPAATDEQPETVRLIRRVPAARAATLEPLTAVSPLGSDPGAERAPSHVLYEGRAIALDHGPVTVGRGSFRESDTAIVLPEGLAGVSRRHCTFLHDGEHLVLVDHSSFGTYLNGERVADRVRVVAGDRVRIGEPGVELSLIAVGT